MRRCSSGRGDTLRCLVRPDCIACGLVPPGAGRKQPLADELLRDPSSRETFGSELADSAPNERCIFPLREIPLRKVAKPYGPLILLDETRFFEHACARLALEAITQRIRRFADQNFFRTRSSWKIRLELVDLLHEFIDSGLALGR